MLPVREIRTVSNHLTGNGTIDRWYVVLNSVQIDRIAILKMVYRKMVETATAGKFDREQVDAQQVQGTYCQLSVSPD